MYCCNIHLLDDEQIYYSCKASTKSNDILETIYNHLNIDDTRFFGLKFLNRHSNRTWLKFHKPVAKQFKGCSNNIKLNFRVKWYPTHHIESIAMNSKKLIVMQIKRDLIRHRLLIDFNQALHFLAFYSLIEFKHKIKIKKSDLEKINIIPSLNSKILDEIIKTRIAIVKENIDPYDRIIGMALNLFNYGLDPYICENKYSFNLYLGINHYGLSLFINDTLFRVYNWLDIIDINSHKNSLILSTANENREKTSSELVFKNSDLLKNVLYAINFRIYINTTPLPDIFNFDYFKNLHCYRRRSIGRKSKISINFFGVDFASVIQQINSTSSSKTLYSANDSVFSSDKNSNSSNTSFSNVLSINNKYPSLNANIDLQIEDNSESNAENNAEPICVDDFSYFQYEPYFALRQRSSSFSRTSFSEKTRERLKSDLMSVEKKSKFSKVGRLTAFDCSFNINLKESEYESNTFDMNTFESMDITEKPPTHSTSTVSNEARASSRDSVEMIFQRVLTLLGVLIVLNLVVKIFF